MPGVSVERLKELGRLFDPPLVEWRIGRAWVVKDATAQAEPPQQGKPQGKQGAQGQKGKPLGGTIHAEALAYLTDRTVLDTLDEVCGADNWCNRFREHPMGPQYGVLCALAIRLADVGWVAKWDTGGVRKWETAKSAISDSEKRAAVKWGLGRYLYRIGPKEVEVSKGGSWDSQIKAGYTETGRLPDDEGGHYFRWRVPLLPREFWPSTYVPPDVTADLQGRKDQIRQALVARNRDLARRLLGGVANSDKVSAAQLAEVQLFTIQEICKRLPDGEMPDLARELVEAGLLTSDHWLTVENTIDSLMQERGTNNASGTRSPGSDNGSGGTGASNQRTATDPGR